MMPNEPSRTALIIARQRAAHQVLDHGSILYDPFAMKILREDEKDMLQFANEHPLASIGRLFTTARSRIAEDALSRAVERGVRQIVILGAGLDTFALRNPHGARQIRIYEVDHPATQAWKRQRLAEAQIALPPWLILVPVDFERDDVGEKLVAAGFQQNSPAFFTWLGVVPYLTAKHAFWADYRLSGSYVLLRTGSQPLGKLNSQLMRTGQCAHRDRLRKAGLTRGSGSCEGAAMGRWRATTNTAAASPAVPPIITHATTG